MSLSLKEVISLLKSNGYKEYQRPKSEWLFFGQKAVSSLTTHLCENNESSHINVEIYTVKHGAFAPNVEFELVGENNGIWFNFTAYSIPLTEINQDVIDLVEKKLIAAWNAIK